MKQMANIIFLLFAVLFLCDCFIKEQNPYFYWLNLALALYAIYKFTKEIDKP